MQVTRDTAERLELVPGRLVHVRPARGALTMTEAEPQAEALVAAETGEAVAPVGS